LNSGTVGLFGAASAILNGMSEIDTGSKSVDGAGAPGGVIVRHSIGDCF